MKKKSLLMELEKEKEIKNSLFKVTHEIKNPIAVCKGYLDMMDLSDKGKSTKYISIIKEEVNRTLTIMDDLVSYNKINVNKDILDIFLLLNDACMCMDSLFKVKKIDKIIDILDDEIYVVGDYNRLKQVLVNLIKNASEAMDKSIRKIMIRGKVKGDRAVIEIVDNGAGMNDEVMGKIKEAFFTTKRHGSGLGVSISNEIVRLHGGIMDYQSKEGVGTLVRLSLPIKKLSY